MTGNRKETKTERQEGAVRDPAAAAKARRLMNIVRAAAVLLAAAGLFLCMRFLLNEAFLRDWRRGEYTDAWERPLLPVNFPESWLPLYHMGNVSYMREDYDTAVSWYEKALEKNPPEEEKECAVRINLALALLHRIDYEQLETEQEIRAAVGTLQAARSVLTEHGCADPDGTDGHSAEAEQLKKEIDELLKRLQADGSQSQDQKQESREQKEESGDPSDDRQESGREKQIRKELEKQRKESAKERAKAQESGGWAEDGSGSGGFDGKTW